MDHFRLPTLQHQCDDDEGSGRALSNGRSGGTNLAAAPARALESDIPQPQVFPMKLPTFLRKTPAETIGRTGTQPRGGAVSDEAFWDRLKRSDAAQQILAEDEALRLARRRELVAQIDAATEDAADREPVLIRKRDEATERRERSQAEFRSAIEAEQIAQAELYRLGDLTRSIIGPLERELRETCDPQFIELGEWFDQELLHTRGCMPALEIVMGSGASRAGFSQEALEGLRRRMEAITSAKASLEILKVRALSTVEIASEIRALVGTIPDLPAGISEPSRRHREIDVARFATAGGAKVDETQQNARRQPARAALSEKIAAKSDRRARQ